MLTPYLPNAPTKATTTSYTNTRPFLVCHRQSSLSFSAEWWGCVTLLALAAGQVGQNVSRASTSPCVVCMTFLMASGTILPVGVMFTAALIKHFLKQTEWIQSKPLFEQLMRVSLSWMHNRSGMDLWRMVLRQFLGNLSCLHVGHQGKAQLHLT
jgi:hypothetical protein